MSGKSNLIYKGIECQFSESAESIVSTQELKVQLLDKFFECEPIGEIEWITLEQFNEAKNHDSVLPIYSIYNGIETLLLRPMLHNGDLILFVENINERPDLKNDLEG